MSIQELKKYSLVYLTTPYSKYPSGLHEAFMESARIAGMLLLAEIKVYSPISHTHPIALYAGIDPLDHDIWLPFDQTMMNMADCMVIANMEGWEQSRGIQHEIETFAAAGKPIFLFCPKTFEIDRVKV